MADGYGPKGYPKYGPDSNAEVWTKLEEVGAFAAKVGNRLVGTKAQRERLSVSTTAADQAWLGVEFRETDTGVTYECVGVSPLAWKRTTIWGGLKAGNTDVNGLVTVAHPLGVAPSIVHVTQTYLDGAAQELAKLFEPVVWIVNSTHIQIRFKRTDTGAWAASGQPLAFMLSAHV